MFTFLKNLFGSKDVIRDQENQGDIADILARLIVMRGNGDVEHVFDSPVGKIFLVATYTTDFTDLSNNLCNQDFRRTTLSAVNVFSFFGKGTDDINQCVDGLIRTVMGMKKVSPLIKHDLMELYDAYKALRETEEIEHAQ